MNTKEFAWRIIELSPQIIKALAHYEHNDLTRGEITLPQFWALDFLYRQERGQMSRIAQYLGISRASMTGLIDRLIAQKLVAREDDPRDRRIVWITLTGKGRNVILNIRKQKIRTLIKVFGRISAKDRRRYLNILEQIVKITNSL